MNSVLRIIGSPFRWALIALITGYRQFVSPMLGPRCRYHPSCSAYGLAAVQQHGALKGVVLTTWRVLRCNPFSGGGVDPVPAKGRWRPDVLPNGQPRRADDRVGLHALRSPVPDDPAHPPDQGV